MALFFPKEYSATPYRALYDSLSPVNRVMIQREFVGVSYLRRFHLLKNSPSGPSFKNDQLAAGNFFHRKLAINRLVWWRQEDLVKTHLKLIFRHYLFGFLVQLASRKQELPLPPPSPSCYWETPANLVVMRWMNRHRQSWENAINSSIDQVVSKSIRHLFIYCLLTFIIAQKLYDRNELADEIKAFNPPMPGITPIGIEMEFSNLGRLATNKDNPPDLIRQDPFRNMEYYDSFLFEDITWRLGGYVDTHEHGRRLLSLSRYGGFFEYSMIRVDYPRTYTLPLTTDPEIANQMICESLDFINEIRPHSLHINIEKRGNGEIEPKLDDFLCLLLLGGDLGYNEDGQLKEKRFADKEFHRVIKLRRHLSLFTETKKDVIEYAFLRLWKKGTRNYDYRPVILALKGFQYVYHLGSNCLDQLPGMQSWAEKPYPLPTASLDNFVNNVVHGLETEGVYSADFLADYTKELSELLLGRQQLLH